MTEKYTQHELGKLMPPMTDDEYSDLLEGMKLDGFDHDHPITLFEGQILDGWHRNLAAIDAGISRVSFAKFTGTQEDARKLVVRENMSRRHLSTSQRSMIAAKLVEMDLEMPAEDKDPKRANLPSGPKVSALESIEKHAQELNVSPRSVKAARAVRKRSQKAAEDVASGKTTLNKASKNTDTKTAAYATAVGVIEQVLGADWVKGKTKLSKSEVIQMSGIIPEEMKRIRPYIESGWKYQAAMGHESVSLTLAHTFRQGIERAIGNNGKLEFSANAYKKEWQITITEKPTDQP